MRHGWSASLLVQVLPPNAERSHRRVDLFFSVFADFILQTADSGCGPRSSARLRRARCNCGRPDTVARCWNPNVARKRNATPKSRRATNRTLALHILGKLESILLQRAGGLPSRCMWLRLNARLRSPSDSRQRRGGTLGNSVARATATAAALLRLTDAHGVVVACSRMCVQFGADSECSLTSHSC